MIKEEFEMLAIKGHGTISGALYDAIERHYMSDSFYKWYNNCKGEDKFQFVQRVFGGKVNTPAGVLRKITAEAIKENRWFLEGKESPARLKEMDQAIRRHYRKMAEAIY